MSQTHNENSRVKIPAVLHLMRLGYDYLSLKNENWDNRTYKSYRYGYVVDFADIEREFDKTNRAYWDELSNELGDEIGSYSQLFKTAEEIEQEIADIKTPCLISIPKTPKNFAAKLAK